MSRQPRTKTTLPMPVVLLATLALVTPNAKAQIARGVEGQSSSLHQAHDKPDGAIAKADFMGTVVQQTLESEASNTSDGVAVFRGVVIDEPVRTQPTVEPTFEVGIGIGGFHLGPTTGRRKETHSLGEEMPLGGVGERRGGNGYGRSDAGRPVSSLNKTRQRVKEGGQMSSGTRVRPNVGSRGAKRR